MSGLGLHPGADELGWTKVTQARRLLADRRVGTKIMLAVLVVALLSIADGLFALDSLGETNDQVKTGYRLSLEVDTVGDLRGAVNRTWLAADDYMLATGAAGRTAAGTALKSAAGQVDQFATAYEAFPLRQAAATAIAGFRIDWTQYRTVVDETLLPLADRGDRTGLAQVRAARVAPLMTSIRARLTALADTSVAATAGQEVSAESRYHSTRTWVLIMLIGSALLGVTLATAVSRMITGPLSRCVDALRRISAGDLTARVGVGSTDEVGEMSAALNQTAEAMTGMVTSVHSSSDVLASASEQLTSVSGQLSDSAEETSAQAGTVSQAAGQVSDGVRAVSAGAEEMGVSIREIANNANEAAGVAADAARTAASTNASVARLGEASAQIGTVVASEVKDLAQETARATQDITAQVASIQAETGTAVAAIAEIGQVIATINDYATTIAAAVEEQTATTAEIARSVGQAAEGSTSIADTIAGVAQAAQQVTSGAAETRQTAAELARTAHELQVTVSSYQI